MTEKQASAWARLGPILDLATPMALRVAATLRLADLIDDGGTDLPTLAARAECDADALGRTLRLLISKGVFSEPQPGVFAVNELAGLLRAGHPEGMGTWLDLTGFGGQMDLAFTGLLHTVRTGEPAWPQVFGSPFWEYLAQQPELASSFDATMVAGEKYFADSTTGYDFSAASHVVDVGGGAGIFVGTLLRAYPQLRSTVVDLPSTVDRAREYLEERGVADRCTFAAGSFFDPLPAGADVYVLRGVIHDWDDAHAEAILRRCAQAAGERGTVLMIEAHGTGGDDPDGFAEMNLRMLVLCGGKERSIAEFGALAERAGLRLGAHTTTDLGNIFLPCTRE